MSKFLISMIVYFAAMMATKFISMKMDWGLPLIQKLKINTTPRVVLFSGAVSALLYVIIHMIATLAMWKIDPLILTFLNVGFTMGLVLDINQRLSALDKKAAAQKGKSSRQKQNRSR